MIWYEVALLHAYWANVIGEVALAQARGTCRFRCKVNICDFPEIGKAEDAESHTSVGLQRIYKQGIKHKNTTTDCDKGNRMLQTTPLA